MYAVIFTSELSNDAADYEEASARMVELSRTQPGFIDITSARGADGSGITVCYWESLDAIDRWRRNTEHEAVQQVGRLRWYERYDVKVCEVLER